MNKDKIEFREFVPGKPSTEKITGTENEMINEMLKWIKEIENAKEIAIKEKVFANVVVINENYIKTPPLSIGFSYSDLGIKEGYNIPPMICGLEVHPTKTFLPDNVAFAVMRAPMTEFERKLNQEIEKFTNMLAENCADIFGTPCDYAPLDMEMWKYCVPGKSCKENAVDCWKRVFKKWEKENE